jgi:hypothetical protein
VVSWDIPDPDPAAQSIMDALSQTAAELRDAYRRAGEGFFLVVPWYAVESRGGWEPFCEYFTGFTRRTLTSPPIAGCESIDTHGRLRKFTVPPPPDARGPAAAAVIVDDPWQER